DHPFQNWTYKSADLLAHCYIYTDYTVPVRALRDELGRILKSTPLWAGKVCVLQVSQLQQFTVQIRALMDARTSGDAWDLRCVVREQMIEFLSKNYPGSFPKYRGEFQTTAETGHILEAPPEDPQGGESGHNGQHAPSRSERNVPV